MMRFLQRCLIWGVVALLITLAVVLTWSKHQKKQHLLASLKWPETTAVIVESTVDELPNSKSGTRMVVSLLVAYSVEGVTYQESVTRLFSRVSDRNYKNLLREGASISLRYNPENPSSFSMSPLLPD